MSEPFKIYFKYSMQKDERFIENLLSAKKFCISCGEHYCDDCREDYGPFSENIVGVYQFPDDLPPMIEEPEEFLPIEIPPANIILAVNLHNDILMSIPEFAHKHGIDTVIVPVEIGEMVQVTDNLLDVTDPEPFFDFIGTMGGIAFQISLVDAMLDSIVP